MISLRHRLAFVANIFLLAFHANDLTLFGIFRRQRVFQKLLDFCSLEEHPELLLLLDATATLYGLLTVKLPFGV